MEYYIGAWITAGLMAVLWHLCGKVADMGLKDVPNSEAAEPIKAARFSARGLILIVGGWILASCIIGMYKSIIH